ncbi:nucleoside triphosphate pyrophosphohydrolase [Varunaivibrio sulfuroxidans]|uniref:Nucleoside triphosphate pyrophosphohydrolase n=1 Tax=Varunaivibrio sulfuroxidans TaxID=1773489 RepID=A0A4V6NYH1_9PROT|nr:nucleoside triphosphate pyrophosphohydrolase [Varunaivibrio sulfuroxidans]TCS61211.1 ATP diphosphatase [Varunaivibrio sulfuroxidans]WES31168.1 nucleoside triphosphate pyrophosphohydrolase [Varunaivibrio sulfuroxidans]
MDSDDDTPPSSSVDDQARDTPSSGHVPGNIARLLDIMAHLRDPARGCPWDCAQTFSTIAPYTIEEAYEVADAIDKGDMAHLKDELGDLLFQVVFYAQLGREKSLFEFSDIVQAIIDKMIRRHPHVFADDVIASREEQVQAWDGHKQRERAGKMATSAMDDLALALPALSRAEKIQKRAALVGFDWPNAEGAFAKINEELGEIKDEIDESAPPSAALEAEVGDLLFSCVNLSRHLNIAPEKALRQANAKFINRFRTMETQVLKSGKTLGEVALLEMDSLWEAAKRDEDDS